MEILEMQLLQERVAWSVVDMYAMAAVISRLQSELAAAGVNGKLNGNGHSNGNGNGNGNVHANGNGHVSQLKRDLVVGKGFCRRAAANVRHRLKSLWSNTDADTLAVADVVLDQA
jgi:hypothetical protein